MRIEEVERPLPKAWSVKNYKILSNKQELLNTLVSMDHDPETTALFLEEDVEKLGLDNSITWSGIGTLESYKHIPNGIQLKYTSDGPGLLILSQAYWKGWQATDNGETIPVTKSNAAFLAMPIKKGMNEIALNYKPWTIKIGYWLSGLSLLLFISAIFFF